MAFRQRIISKGYYDHLLNRHVLPITLNQAALNMDFRHKLITHADQHIEKKTLDDYYKYIRLCSDPKCNFDLRRNKNKDVALMRKHFCD